MIMYYSVIHYLQKKLTKSKEIEIDLDHTWEVVANCSNLYSYTLKRSKSTTGHIYRVPLNQCWSFLKMCWSAIYSIPDTCQSTTLLHHIEIATTTSKSSVVWPYICAFSLILTHRLLRWTPRQKCVNQFIDCEISHHQRDENIYWN